MCLPDQCMAGGVERREENEGPDKRRAGRSREETDQMKGRRRG